MPTREIGYSNRASSELFRMKPPSPLLRSCFRVGWDQFHASSVYPLLQQAVRAAGPDGAVEKGVEGEEVSRLGVR